MQARWCIFGDATLSQFQSHVSPMVIQKENGGAIVREPRRDESVYMCLSLDHSEIE